MFGLCGRWADRISGMHLRNELAGGEVAVIDGKTTTRPTPSESIRQGMAFICEDRRGKAMIPAFSVEENMMLSSIDRYEKRLVSKAGSRQKGNGYDRGIKDQMLCEPVGKEAFWRKSAEGRFCEGTPYGAVDLAL